MRIDSGWSGTVATNGDSDGARITARRSQSPDRAGAPMESAQLQFGELAATNIEAQVASVPELRNEKVQALRQAINEGSYQVNCNRVAEAIYRDFQGWPRS